ncbi:hypothetical protein A4X13_0g6846 [Tilletia indica]|uniref:Uncharacterized protein n=1 Tax=Tilletia indica TaxID=43049 RepID=A0A177TXZ8_9BASI|nr:hypothetical protein A4X13_0g6846 [Tilletia indica]
MAQLQASPPPHSPSSQRPASSSSSSMEFPESPRDPDASPAEAQADLKPSNLTPDPETPLVSILCNPKNGSNVAGAGELTRPTIAIPEADASADANADANKSSGGISPTATFSAIKNAFSRKSSSNMRKQAQLEKANAARPLGKSFKRDGPPPLDAEGKIQGAPLLDADPRTASSDQEDVFEGGSSSDLSSSVDSLSQASSSSSSAGPVGRRTVSNGSVGPSTSNRSGSAGLLRSISNASSVQSGSSKSSQSGPDGRRGSAHTIRFCPLPATGRLKRANSITIGIAARSQILLSQGNGPVPRGQQQSWTQGGPSTPSRSGVHPTDSRYSGFQDQRAAAWYEAGGDVPADVIDVGAELRKVGMKAWRRMRGEDKKDEPTIPEMPTAASIPKKESKYPDKKSNAEDDASQSSNSSRRTYEADENDAEADGMKTPRARSGPHSTQSLIMPLTSQDASGTVVTAQ